MSSSNLRVPLLLQLAHPSGDAVGDGATHITGLRERDPRINKFWSVSLRFVGPFGLHHKCNTEIYDHIGIDDLVICDMAWYRFMVRRATRAHRHEGRGSGQ
jgi:hypothetical protein